MAKNLSVIDSIETENNMEINIFINNGKASIGFSFNGQDFNSWISLQDLQALNKLIENSIKDYGK